MHRPRVSEENYERLSKYSGESFDDRLGGLILAKSLVDKMWTNDILRASKWKSIGITSTALNIGLLVYIGWFA